MTPTTTPISETMTSPDRMGTPPAPFRLPRSPLPAREGARRAGEGPRLRERNSPLDALAHHPTRPGERPMPAIHIPLTLLAVLAFGLTAARGGEPSWKKHTINGKSAFETAGAFDVDNDGKIDIVSGDTWYQAPEWTPHKVREVTRTGTYLNDFATLPVDVNGDRN